MEKNIPQLYYVPASAPCRSVLMVAAALRLKLNLKQLNLMEGDHLRPTFLRISPHHTVPTLVDNEFSMFESRAICIYLVEKYGKNDALYPKNAKTRASINQLIYFDMGTLFKRFYDYFMPAFRGEPQEPQKLESLKEALGFLDDFLVEKKFAVGYKLTIADLILLASVSTIDTVGMDLSNYKNVSKWYDNLKNTAPGWKENADGLEMMKQMMASMVPPKETVEVAKEAAPSVVEVTFKPNIEIIPNDASEPVKIEPLIEVTPAVQPIQPLLEVEPAVQSIQPLLEVTPAVEPIQPLLEVTPAVEPVPPAVEPIQPLLEVEPTIEVTPAVIQPIVPLIEVEPASAEITSESWHPAVVTTETTTQQITPLIEVTMDPVQTSSETVTEVTTTSTKEVSGNQEITEVITEVREIVTTTEQVTGITKVIHIESETKSEVVNGAIEIVQNGKYEGEEVKI